MSHKLRLYLYGAIAAGVQSFFGGLTVIGVDSTKFNMTTAAGVKSLAIVCLVMGVGGFGAYIKNHPIPSPADSDFPAAAQAVISKVVAQTTKDGGPGPRAAGLKLE